MGRGPVAPGRPATEPEHWQAAAYCATDPDAWSLKPGRADLARAAADACTDRCPVLDQCAAWSAQHEWVSVVVAGRIHNGQPPWKRKRKGTG
jgi:hypothetical protein